MYWMFFILVMLAAVIAGVVYMTVAVGRFGLLKKLAGEKKLLRILLPLLCIALVLTLITLLLNFFDAVIVFLHVTVFFLIFGRIMKLVKHIRKKDFKYYWQGWLSLGFSAAYLAIAFYLCTNVWETDYTLSTDKELGTLKVAMFSDSHIGAVFDGDGFAEHMKAIEAAAPDILFIAGDFVDDGTKKEDMEKACEALGQLQLKYGVWYVSGNHDKGYYHTRSFSFQDLEQMLEKNSVHVLEDECVLVDGRFYVAGRRDSSDHGRKDINELLKGVDESRYVIVLDHQPDDYANEAESASDLVLSGHTHGGQLFPMNFIGQWGHVDDRIYGHEVRNGKDFIVSSGIADWEIHFKSGTYSEFVIVTIEGK